MSTFGLLGAWLTGLARSLPAPLVSGISRPSRIRVPGGEKRKGKWSEPVGAPKDKYATMSRQRRRRDGFKRRVVALNAEFGFNMPRKVRRAVAWDSWRA